MIRAASITLLLLTACSDDGGGRGFSASAEVATLDPSQQQQLCEDFLDDICAGPLASFCDDPCIVTSCATAATGGNITTECDGYTAGMVDDCAEAGTFEVCAQGGGCMFDALEAVCREP
jgi:hypothetical protein